MADVKEFQGGIAAKTADQHVNSRDWHAWINTMPPGPNQLYVIGEIELPNPGIKTFLTPREPQGSNPTHLQLDLYLLQRPGLWPQMVVWAQAHYNKIVPSAIYTAVEIFHEDTLIQQIEVQTIS